MELARHSRHVFRFGLFEADTSGNTLTRNGTRVKIQDQPFRALLMLLERPGEIITREELRQKLWPEGIYVDFDGGLNAILKRLRLAIDDDSDNPRFIETIPRRGYRFIAPVSASGPPGAKTDATELPSAVSPQSESSPADSTRMSKEPRRVVLAYTASILAVIGLIAAAEISWYRRPTNANRLILSAHASPPVSMRTSVAVLGFHNLSGNASDAWLATAFSEMLSTELAGGEKLRLISGQDVANLRATSPWPQTGTLDQKTATGIGTVLNSDVLVMGSYATVGSPEGGQLRFDVQLQDAKTGEILTETSETGQVLSLFPMVSSVGGKLRDRLGVPRLESQEQASALATLPSNPEAARLYSLGLAQLRGYDYSAAHDLFDQAIKAEPKFPFSHTMLASAEISLGYDDKAKAEAKKGVDLGVAAKLARTQQMEIEATYYQALGQRDKAAEIYKVLFNLFPDSLEYGLQLAKMQLGSAQPDASLETLKQLRRLPSPASDDPALDLSEAKVLRWRDPEASQRLAQSAAEKAQKQGKKFAYATAEQYLCGWNRRHVPSPPECQEAYNIFIASGNRDAAASTLQVTAETNRLTGHDKSAITLYQRAIKTFKETGDREAIGVTLNNLSLVLTNEGQWGQAEAYYREARQNFQAVDDRTNTAVAMGNIAYILFTRGHLAEARDMLQKARELMESSGPRRTDGFYISEASLLLMQGESPQARSEIETHLKLLRSFGREPYLLADAISAFGDAQKAEGNLEGAGKSYEEAIDVFKKVGYPVGNLQVSLADVALAEGHPDAAVALLQPAIAELEKEQDRGDEIGAYVSLSRALLAEGKAGEARDAIGKASRLADLHEFPVLRLPLQILDARAIGAKAKPGPAGRADLAAAGQKLRAAVQESHRLKLYMIECEARLALGEVEMKLDPGVGRGQLKELAAETHTRGYELYSRQATEAMTSGDALATPGNPVH